MRVVKAVKQDLCPDCGHWHDHTGRPLVAVIDSQGTEWRIPKGHMPRNNTDDLGGRLYHSDCRNDGILEPARASTEGREDDTRRWTLEGDDESGRAGHITVHGEPLGPGERVRVYEHPTDGEGKCAEILERLRHLFFAPGSMSADEQCREAREVLGPRRCPTCEQPKDAPTAECTDPFHRDYPEDSIRENWPHLYAWAHGAVESAPGIGKDAQALLTHLGFDLARARSDVDAEGLIDTLTLAVNEADVNLTHGEWKAIGDRIRERLQDG
jgi:hypothetical protein